MKEEKAFESRTPLNNLGVEFVVAQIQRSVNRLERLEVNIHFLFFIFGSQNGAAVNHKTIWWHFRIKLQFLLCRDDGGQDRQPNTNHTWLGQTRLERDISFCS